MLKAVEKRLSAELLRSCIERVAPVSIKTQQSLKTCAFALPPNSSTFPSFGSSDIVCPHRADGMGVPDFNVSGSNLGYGRGVNHQHSRFFPFPTKTVFESYPPQTRASEPVDTAVCPARFTGILVLIVNFLQFWFTYTKPSNTSVVLAAVVVAVPSKTTVSQPCIREQLRIRE